MPFGNLKDNAEDIQEKLKNVLDSNVAYYKLWLFKIAMKSTTMLLKVLFMAVFFMFFLLFASLALALYLSGIFESYALGFLSVGGMYILLLLVVYLAKDNLLESRLLEKFSQVFFNE